MTAWILTAALAGLIGFDVWAAMSPQTPTISRVVREYGRRYPSIVLTVGYLLGHFWPQ